MGISPYHAQLLTKIKQRPISEQNAIIQAYLYAEKVHMHQKRLSDEPYIVHLVETACIIDDLHGDTTTMIAGLLHDILEDTQVSLEEVLNIFGEEIVFLIQGVTKLSTLKYRGLKRHAESLRKLFIAMAEDTRVIVIKLADRLHNMRTIKYLKPDKQKRIAEETLDIYAPLAHRLSMGTLKSELEDLSFQIINPQAYAITEQLMYEKSRLYTDDLTTIKKLLQEKLHIEAIQVHAIDTRKKHLYSLNKKLQRNDMHIESIFDVFALRVIVKTIHECYTVLGIVHAHWQPVPNRIKDYIASPKINGYQSIHTTIFTGTGSIIEVQIRTQIMHEYAERGNASHVRYKTNDHKSISPHSSEAWMHTIKTQSKATINRERLLESKIETTQKAWLQNMVAEQKDIIHAQHFVKSITNDFLRERIFVFTPRGEIIDLPIGATSLDFAYALHSDIGNHVHAVKVNGRLIPLNRPLVNGDIVQIETNKKSAPSEKWLRNVVTTCARKHIRLYLTKERNTIKKN